MLDLTLSLLLLLKQNIRIFNGCEVLIENSVTRITVRHQGACRVMPNSYPSDGIFNLHRRTIIRKNDVKTSESSY